ncbi:MAG: MarR family winged helix-turn-helix transcriptional regulator [Thermomicrobiales bacterium]
MQEVVQATGNQRASGPAVHPGWLSSEPFIDAAVAAGVQAARFAAFAQILRTAGALDRAATDILADLGLTAGAFGALLELERVGESGLAPSELARKLAVARRTSTLYVDILVRNGWAERRPHPADRRMVLASLTPEGETLLLQVGEAYKQRLAALVGDISPVQAERLRQLLTLIPLDAAEHGAVTS